MNNAEKQPSFRAGTLNLLSVEQNISVSREIKTCQQAQKRAFAAPARPMILTNSPSFMDILISLMAQNLLLSSSYSRIHSASKFYS